jgi:DNA-binding LacI/PurR family transcriptional regulator
MGVSQGGRRRASVRRDGDGSAPDGRHAAPGGPPNDGDAGRAGRPKRNPTMQDIADAAGVSQSTVSRILTGSHVAIPINPATRERVLETARRMRYRPNPLARGLRGARTMLLGVIVREITDPFFAGAVDAISDEASKRGYNVVLGTAHSDSTEAIALRAVLETRHCDAIILVGDTSDQPLLLRDLHETNATVVGAWQGSSSLDGVATVNVDNKAGMVDLVDHLLALGHRKVAFIGGRFAAGSPLGDIYQRRLALLDRLRDCGIETPGEYLTEAPNSLGGGAEAFEALMRLPNRPTAVVASTDVLALGALHGACRLDMAVPGDVSIAGFDDLPEAEYSNPPLTTVRQPIADMAAVAVRAAIDDSDHEARETVQTLCPRLVVRESTGPAPVA